MDVIIVNSTHINMVQQTSTTITHASMMAAQKKTQSYFEQTLGDDFIPFAIKTYRCFHYHFDSFLTVCAHTIIAHHQWSSLIPSMFFKCVHSPIAWASHNNSLVSCYTWLGFFIFSTHHI